MREIGGERGTVHAVQAALSTRSPRRWVSHVGRFALKYPLGAIGGATLLVIVFVAVFASQIAPYDPLFQDTPSRLQGPGIEFWFGTDSLGRDAFSRLVFGSRISLFVGLISVAIGTTTGTFLGVTSAYFGGWFDLQIQRVVDAFMGFPSLVLALVLVMALGGSLTNVTLAIAITLIPRMVRISRSSALSVKSEVYVLSAQALGCSSTRVVLRYIVPNSLAPVFVLATSYLGTAIVAEASLSFLGLGVPAPHPSWGGMLQFGARGYLEVAPWLAIFPGIALSLVVFSFSFLGDALRDALDPRLRSA